MEQDARTLPDPMLLACSLCIVGAGPAGLTIAERLAGLDVDIILIESGGPGPDESAQLLNEGAVIGTDAYAGLRATRWRAIGGTARLWNTPVRGEAGAKYAPLDGPDFEQRSVVPLSGWPFERVHLEPFYRRAETACGLGDIAWHGADSWVAPAAATGGSITPRIYGFGTARSLLTQKLSRIRGADNIRLIHHATVCALEMDRESRRVVALHGFDGAGRAFRVAARIAVLAGGAVENARLLLAGESAAPGNRTGWLGRCFMEHPRDYALTLWPRSTSVFQDLAFFDAREQASGALIGGRLALMDAIIRAGEVPNASVTLLPRLSKRTRSPNAARRALELLRRFGRQRGTEGYGWSALPDPAEVFDAFRLILNVEQRPNADNRIVIGSSKDALGVRRAQLHWRWTDEEQAGLDRLRDLVRDYLTAAGFGDVDVRRELKPDPNGHHHAGTTRMHRDPRHGVVDPDARVHGTDNLYATGASVFPTAGFANPTLTIVALALRLADHLLERGIGT